MLLLVLESNFGKQWYNQGTTNYGPLFAFVNKVLFKYSQSHSLFAYYLQLSHTTVAQLSSCNIDCMVHKVENIYYGAFYRKSC